MHEISVLWWLRSQTEDLRTALVIIHVLAESPKESSRLVRTTFGYPWSLRSFRARQVPHAIPLGG